MREIGQFYEGDSDAGDVFQALVRRFRITFARAHRVEAARSDDGLSDSESDLKEYAADQDGLHLKLILKKSSDALGSSGRHFDFGKIDVKVTQS